MNASRAKKQASGPDAPGFHLSLPDLVKRSRIEAIDVVKLRVERRHADHMGGGLVYPETLEVVAKVSVQHPERPLADRASFLVGVSCVWRAQGSDEHLAGIEAQVRVAYAYTESSTPPDQELLKQFGTQVALHHAWPFLRERVRTLSGDLGVPPFVLPLHHRP